MLYSKIMALTDRKSLISGVLFLVGICYLIDRMQSHLNTLRIVGLLGWFSLGAYKRLERFQRTHGQG